MEEIAVKTHLIIKDIQEEYNINWCGKIMDSKPMIKNGLPVFIIISSAGRFELNCIDINYIEKCAKRAAVPHGRGAISSDKSYIYILEEDENEKLLGIVTHNRIKKYAPMYDKVGWK